MQRFYFPHIQILTKIPQKRQAKCDSVFAEEESQEGEVSEEQEEEKEEEEEGEEDEQDIMKVLGNLVMAMLIKYWIYVCGGMFFFVSFEGTIVMYKIIYMVLFLFCVALYQVRENCVNWILSLNRTAITFILVIKWLQIEFMNNEFVL